MTTAGVRVGSSGRSGIEGLAVFSPDGSISNFAEPVRWRVL
jgi:hypothetical protein